MSNHARSRKRSSAADADSRKPTAVAPDPNTQAHADGTIAFPSTNSDGPFPRGRAGLVVSIVVAAGWWCVLGWMALTTANPVTINLVQIQEADNIVTGTFADASFTRLSIAREWIVGNPFPPVELVRPPSMPVTQGNEYVVPLSRAAGGKFEITPTPAAAYRHEPGPVYPATDEVIRQLEQITQRHHNP